MRKFAERLKEQRQENEFTQRQMSDMLGITLRAYQNYESLGVNHCEPDQDLQIRMADVLKVSVDYLLGRTEITGEYE